MDFWAGIIIGAFGGATIGVIITGLLVASKRKEYSDIPEVDPHIMGEVGTNNVITTVASGSSVINP